MTRDTSQLSHRCRKLRDRSACGDRIHTVTARYRSGHPISADRLTEAASRESHGPQTVRGAVMEDFGVHCMVWCGRVVPPE